MLRCISWNGWIIDTYTFIVCNLSDKTMSDLKLTTYVYFYEAWFPSAIPRLRTMFVVWWSIEDSRTADMVTTQWLVIEVRRIVHQGTAMGS